MGYAAQPIYFVHSEVITGVHGLKRAKPFVGSRASSTMRASNCTNPKRRAASKGWIGRAISDPIADPRTQWPNILMMPLSNWCMRQRFSRWQASNTAVYSIPSPAGRPAVLCIRRLGRNPRQVGRLFRQGKWDADGFGQQLVHSPPGARAGRSAGGTAASTVRTSLPASEIEDVRWPPVNLSKRFGRRTTRGPSGASGATPPEIDTYARSIRDRIAQLQRLCEGAISTR